MKETRFFKRVFYVICTISICAMCKAMRSPQDRLDLDDLLDAFEDGRDNWLDAKTSFKTLDGLLAPHLLVEDVLRIRETDHSVVEKVAHHREDGVKVKLSAAAHAVEIEVKHLEKARLDFGGEDSAFDLPADLERRVSDVVDALCVGQVVGDCDQDVDEVVAVGVVEVDSVVTYGARGIEARRDVVLHEGQLLLETHHILGKGNV